MKTAQPRTVLADRYVLEEEIGRGHLGTVWRAVDRVLDRPVAVKVLGPDSSADAARRFAEAARSLALLSHPGLVRVLDAGTTDEGIAFLVTEDTQGESLRDLIAGKGPLDPDGATEILTRVLEALAAAHHGGVLHLDLEPENVFVGPDGRVRVADAGLARAVGVETTHPAPEQVAGGPGDERTDVYAVGAILYEALVGRPPGARDASPRAAGARVPRSLDGAVKRALAPDPADRFRSADEFARALPSPTWGGQAAALRLPVHPQPRSAPPPAPQDDRREFFKRWMLVPVALTVIAASVIGVGLRLGRLELGGPVGVRPKPEPSLQPQSSVLQARAVSTYDPFGDGSENDGGVPLATDGDPDTAWRSENYFDGRLNKEGVGLLFDLGTSRTVTGFRLTTPAPGFRFAVLVGENPSTLAAADGPTFEATADMRERIEPAEGRYVLLWVTTVVPTGDGNRAEVGEFEVLGTDG